MAVRLDGKRPISLEPEWRKLHVFLPSGESCPYDLLVSGAFNSNLSRQEIRIEQDRLNYNRFLLRHVAHLLRDQLLPALENQNQSISEVIRLLDRGVHPGTPARTAAAQALYEEVRRALETFPFIPREDGSLIAPQSCVVPIMVQDNEVGQDYSSVLPAFTSFEGRFFPAAHFCRSDIARILVDHGAKELQPSQAVAVLAKADPVRSRAQEDLERGVAVDPVLRILERLWAGLEPQSRSDLNTACAHHPLFPVSINKDGTLHRVETDGLECFYPPRSLAGEVPLAGLCFLARDLCWGALIPRERNSILKHHM